MARDDKPVLVPADSDETLAQPVDDGGTADGGGRYWEGQGEPVGGTDSATTDGSGTGT